MPRGGADGSAAAETLHNDSNQREAIARIHVVGEGIYWGDNHYGGMFVTKK